MTTYLFSEAYSDNYGKIYNDKESPCWRRKIKKGLKPTEAFSECGFSDYATFFKNYKKIFGCSPAMEGKSERPHEIIT